MSAERVERIFNDIGRYLSQDSEYTAYPMLLYAQAGDNFAGASIFRDLGHQALYRRHPDTPVERLLMELWNLFPPTKQWVELEYVLRDGRFNVAFVYPDDIPAYDDYFDRRRRAVHRHFGEKPIVYPPFERGGDDIYEL